MEEIQEDAEPMRRCAEKRCGQGSGRAMERCRRWTTSHVGKQKWEMKEGLQGGKERERAGSGPGVIRPPVATASTRRPLDLSKPWCKEVAELIEEVHQCGLWPQQACTTRFLS